MIRTKLPNKSIRHFNMTTINVVITGTFTGLTILLGYFENYLAIPPWAFLQVNMDISLVPLMVILLICSSPYLIFSIIISSVIRFTWAAIWIGPVVLLVYQFCFLYIFKLVWLLLLNSRNNGRHFILWKFLWYPLLSKDYERIRNFDFKNVKEMSNKKTAATFLITALFVVFIFTFLNGIFIMPLYAYQLSGLASMDQDTVLEWYDESRIFFGIKSYWWGIIAFFGSFNALKTIIVITISLPSMISIQRSLHSNGYF